MKTHTPEDALAWLHDVVEHEQCAPPSDELCEHIATCNSCKGALVLVLAELLDAPLPAFEVTAQQCDDDLAAYIDMERHEGAHAAIREYPHVWWHLWTSPGFAETYHLTKVLIEAEDSGDLRPLSVAVPATTHISRIFPQLRVSSSMLQQAISPRQLLGIARGADNDAPVFVEEKNAEYTMNITVQLQHDDTWNIIVTMVPPVSGSAVLTRGDTRLTAPFNAQGVACMESVPGTLLTVDDGSDLVIHIQTADELL